MSRRANLIARIERALDRAYASLDGDSDHSSASIIFTCHDSAEWFIGWKREAVREIVLEFARRAPLSELRQMAESADDEVRFCERWDAVEWYEGKGFAPLFPSRAEAERWAS